VKARLDLSTQVLIGLVAGIAVGLFIGDRASMFQVWGDAYVQLLQMTVLPYVAMSLVGGLGALKAGAASRLGARFALLLLALWVVALLAVFSFPLMFPHIESASFFSTTLLEDSPPLDLVGLYIPANPFNALANNVVPAVVLFSALLGLALIGVPRKEAALDAIHVLTRAVERIARFVVALTPYGLFAIAAVVAGTFDPVQAARVQVYLLAYVATSLLLAFWVLPGIVAALTPIPHRAVLARTRDALIMAFWTGSLFVVLPLLAEQTRMLLREYTPVPDDDARLPDVIIPAAYNFPHTAKLLSLSFILFAAWFSGASLPVSRYASLAATGVLVCFGSLNVAIPFLLDMFRIPADAFQLFLATSVVNSRFGTLLSAVHAITMALVGTCAVIGLVRFNVRKLVRFAAITVVLAGVTIGGTRWLAGRMATTTYDLDTVLENMYAVRDRGQAQVFTTTPPPPLPPLTGTVLDRVRERRMLRVGYFDDSLPYAFTNKRGELVGFDVEMALQLARDLGVGLEIVHASRTMFDEGLDPSVCDLVMSGAAVTADRALHVRYTQSYLDETLAFIVLDYRRASFGSWDDVRAAGPLRIGVPVEPYYLDFLKRQLPAATIVKFDTPDRMFQPEDPPLDALVLTAERGSAYTLLHPQYSVVVPKPKPTKIPLAYIVAGRDDALATLVDTWIDLKRKDGTIDELFAHWILGHNATPQKRRWSILDDARVDGAVTAVPHRALAFAALAQSAALTVSLTGQSARQAPDARSVFRSSTNHAMDGTLRRVSVRIVNRPDLSARTRLGYVDAPK
jgi:Na+/H+-dicarboxylate symporter/ABC-type amino acid transport substrate-binding protein